MVNKGEILKFGSYYESNSYEKKPIEWMVLASSGGELLLITKNVIDAKPYDSKSMAELMNNPTLTWENSTIRHWLNNDFLSTAFSSDEKKFIKNTLNENCDFNSPFASKTISGGGNTNDFVFLLSWEEGKKYFKESEDSERKLAPLEQHLRKLQSIGIVGQFNIKDVGIALEGLRAKPTNYALSKNVYVEKEEDGAWWWFRSLGGTGNMATTTMEGDVMARNGIDVDDATIGVRPVMWVSEKAFFHTDEWKEKGLCQYCGGEIKGLFIKRCSVCGKKKDY